MLSQAQAVIATLPAHDLARARSFYEKTLGLTPDNMMPTDENGVLYTVNGHSFLVYRTEAPRGGTTLAGFLVADLEAEMKELRSRGVVFEEYDLPGLKTVNGIAEQPNMRGAWFKDSEGNILALNEAVK
jgi:catechol 2,3-dioxygenase-like lactoylglutathione lyase family enzyme